MLGLRDPLLANRRLDLRVRPPDCPNRAEIRKMSRSQREAQVEQLFFGLACLLLKFPDRQTAQFR